MAENIFEERKRNTDGDLIEMSVWRVPATKKYPDGIKYSLVAIRDGKRIVGYDNAHWHGHHKHIGEMIYDYQFIDIEQLKKDFQNDHARQKRTDTD